MRFDPASAGSVAAFSVIVVAVLAAFLAAVHRSFGSPRTTLRTAVVLAVWLGGLSALVASGRLASFPLNGLPFFFGSILLVCVSAALSSFGRRIAAGIPLGLLVAFQGFRLPLELVLHAWVEQGTIPEAMTWSGRNWDIVSGVAALVCAPFAQRFRGAAWIANVVGFVLLVNVMVTALFSAPVPFGWDVQPKLLLAFHLPYALIGPVCVGGALFGHVVLTWALVAGRPKGESLKP